MPSDITLRQEWSLWQLQSSIFRLTLLRVEPSSFMRPCTTLRPEQTSLVTATSIQGRGLGLDLFRGNTRTMASGTG